MAQNENISLSLANKIDILNKTQSVDARYGVYDNESDALSSMLSYGLDGRQVAVYKDKVNGKTVVKVYNEALHQLEPLDPEVYELIAEGSGITFVDNEDGTYDIIAQDESIIGTINLNADNIPFDNTGTDLDSEEVEGVIKELNTKISTLHPLLTNEDWTLIIDEDNVIWSNITGHTEYFKANGTDRNFVSDFDFATIEVVYVNNVPIERNDYLVLSENEIEIKENITLLNNTPIAIQGSIFIVEPTI